MITYFLKNISTSQKLKDKNIYKNSGPGPLINFKNFKRILEPQLEQYPPQDMQRPSAGAGQCSIELGARRQWK